MKRKFFIIFIIILLFLLTSPIYAYTFWDKVWIYIQHCNLSIGVAYLPVRFTIPAFSTSFYIYDAFGFSYKFTTSWQQQNINELGGAYLGLRLPLYWNDYFSFGLASEGRIFGDTDPSITINGAGFYIEYKKFKVSYVLSVGIASAYCSKVIGEVTPAYTGDPGFYWNGKFYTIGTPLTLSGYSSKSSYYFSFFVKYYFSKPLFLSIGYLYLGSHKIDDFKYYLQDIKISYEQYPLPIIINNLNFIVISIGVGY